MGKHKLLKELSTIKTAQRRLSNLSTQARNAMLYTIADALEQQAQRIFDANDRDLQIADQENIELPLRKRLVFDQNKLVEACAGIRQVAALPDPIGRVRERRLLDDNLLLERVNVPIGVIGMIFESRPDALIQILALCLKSGNAIVLKGGREALYTNKELVSVIREALSDNKVGSEWIVHMESREDVQEILQLDTIIDLLIPRGSNDFVRYIMDNTKIPVLGHADGLSSLYIDKESDIEMALTVTVDSKCQYPAVCNAVETLLVHSAVASQFLPRLKKAFEPWSVIIHGDERVAEIIPCQPATAAVWDTEFLGYEIAIKIVDSLQEAIDHITYHGSAHTDAIITSNKTTAQRFLREVDSADVFWNCSTRFADGFRFGLGAEVGISTQKIHARGPVGLDGLVTSKWLLAGDGQIVAPYAQGKPFKHIDMALDGTSLWKEEA
ncbi:MAG: glutamate-5-semialdehyde dehydrogenase [Sphaerochaetaceae bacterium]|nr:glutamate-5-semialdehyde dehydrogenase [Sphaerochaetaceae bacterium]